MHWQRATKSLKHLSKRSRRYELYDTLLTNSFISYVPDQRIYYLDLIIIVFPVFTPKSDGQINKGSQEGKCIPEEQVSEIRHYTYRTC